MSRILKIIVNVILICAIGTAAALLIPSVLDVPMVVVDDVNMNTNLPTGSVTYAKEKDSSQVKTGDQLLISQDGSQMLYEVKSVSGESCTVEDTISEDGGTQDITLPSKVNQVLFTVPFIGYASMALRSTEGLIIVGLAVVFVIILFILAEIWKKDEEDDDEEAEVEDEDVAEDEELPEDDEEEVPEMSRREARRKAKLEKKLAKKKEKAVKASKKEPEDDEEDIRIAEPVKKKKHHVEEVSENPEEMQHPGDLFAETESSMASAIADMMEQDQQNADAESVSDEEWKPAMPARTKEELLDKAHADGDDPEVREDEISGVTLIDYSDIL